MIQEEKELLRKDLYARLPYGVKVHLSRKHNRPEEDIVLNNVIINKDGFVVSNIIGYNYLLSEIKPYLRSMSSMTKQEQEDYMSLYNEEQSQLLDSAFAAYKGKAFVVPVHCSTIDFLNSHHFDYRGLIDKGLALEASKNMYNIK